MPILFVVRHGQDTDNAAEILNGHRDTELTPLGIEQARDVARKLEGRDIRALLASPLKRAQSTARIIADALKIDVLRTEPLLIERDYGILTGKRLDEIRTYATRILEHDGVTYFPEAPGAESYEALLDRARRFLKSVEMRHPRENVLAVTHAASGRMILAAHRGWTWEEALKRPRFGNAEVLELIR
jgi:probable phosphoglycerate mutase